MTGATTQTAAKMEEGTSKETASGEQHTMAPAYAFPLPGVMDFIGAYVGGELAEERWR
jgi:hypothetical protein